MPEHATDNAAFPPPLTTVDVPEIEQLGPLLFTQTSVKELPLDCRLKESQVGSSYVRVAACNTDAAPIIRKNKPAIGRALKKR
jgi:hypothetical protein